MANHSSRKLPFLFEALRPNASAAHLAPAFRLAPTPLTRSSDNPHEHFVLFNACSSKAFTKSGATRLPGPAHDVSTSSASCTPKNRPREDNLPRPAFKPDGFVSPRQRSWASTYRALIPWKRTPPSPKEFLPCRFATTQSPRTTSKVSSLPRSKFRPWVV